MLQLPIRLPRFASLLAALLLASPALAQAFSADAWLFRERIDDANASNTSIAVLGASDDPGDNDAAIAVRCAGAAGEFQVFLDFDALHGNDGVFAVEATWGEEAPERLELATSADRSAGFVLEAEENAFVGDLRTYTSLAVVLVNAEGETLVYRWTPPEDASALQRLNCIP